MTKIRKGFKIVREGAYEELMSGYGDGFSIEYIPDKWTTRETEHIVLGPLALFDTKKRAEDFMRSHNNACVQRYVYECDYVKSKEGRLYFTNDNGQVLKLKLGALCPDGTLFANKIMITTKVAQLMPK